MQTQSPLEVAQQFMKLKNIEGTLLFASIVGSFSYNLNTPQSDKDYFAVYCAPLRDVLSLPELQPVDVITTSKDTNFNFDITLYEVSKFSELLKEGNPIIIQSLFTSHLYWESDSWKKLKSIRLNFITIQTIKSYVSYIKRQVKYMKEETTRYSKHLYHSFRLLLEIEKMIKCGEPRVWFEGKEKNFLMGVRNQEMEKQEYLKLLKKRLKNVLETLPKLKLPKDISPGTVGFELLNKWLIDVRTAQID